MTTSSNPFIIVTHCLFVFEYLSLTHTLSFRFGVSLDILSMFIMLADFLLSI
jgi:hypothetical protein